MPIGRHAGAHGQRRPDVRRRGRQQARRRAIRRGVKWSPRVGAVYSLNAEDRAARRLRPLLGAVELSGAEQRDAATTARSASRRTRVVPQTAGTPTVTLTNPFPNGLVAPLGNSARRADRRRHDDQLRRSEPHRAARAAVLGRPAAGAARARWRSPSATSARAAITCRSAARTTSRSTSTSSIRSTWRSARGLNAGAARTRSSATPAAGPLATQATLTRAQLLRPYPQFLNVSARQVSEGINRYNAGVVEWSKRTGGRNWFGGRVSYTYSVLKDNQFGETQFLLERRRRPAAQQPTTTSQGSPLLQPARRVRATASSTCRTAS